MSRLSGSGSLRSLGSLASIRSRLTKIHPLSPMKRLPFSPSLEVIRWVPSA